MRLIHYCPWKHAVHQLFMITFEYLTTIKSVLCGTQGISFPLIFIFQRNQHAVNHLFWLIWTKSWIAKRRNGSFNFFSHGVLIFCTFLMDGVSTVIQLANYLCMQALKRFFLFFLTVYFSSSQHKFDCYLTNPSLT